MDSDDDEDSFDKTQRYAQALMSACPSLKLFISLRQGTFKAWMRDPATGKPRFEKKTYGLSDEDFVKIDPEAPLNYFLHFKLRDRSKISEEFSRDLRAQTELAALTR